MPFWGISENKLNNSVITSRAEWSISNFTATFRTWSQQRHIWIPGSEITRTTPRQEGTLVAIFLVKLASQPCHCITSGRHGQDARVIVGKSILCQKGSGAGRNFILKVSKINFASPNYLCFICYGRGRSDECSPLILNPSFARRKEWGGNGAEKQAVMFFPPFSPIWDFPM